MSTVWDHIEGFSPREKWGDPAKMNGLLLLLMSAVRAEFKKLDPDCVVILHCGFEPSGHAPKSQHYFGNACDFHIKTKIPYTVQIARMLDILRAFQVIEVVGLGIYPDWNSPGFHLDVRGFRRRWGRVAGNYVSFEDALIHAEHKDV